MEKAIVHIELDKDLKGTIQRICNDMGISMSEVFARFATAATLDHDFLFEINTDPFYSESNLKRLNQAMAQIKKRKEAVRLLDEEYGDE